MLDLKLVGAKEGFFDRNKVRRAVDRANRQSLSRAGALVRGIARKSIRKPRGKGTAPPGQPPYSHVGLLRKLIFFLFENRKKTVVVGPAKINKPGRAPQLLEHGGRNRKGDYYRGNPYVGPALKTAEPKLAEQWRDSVGR